MRDEFNEAVKALRLAERQWNDAEPSFEDAAWCKLIAARARVDAVVRGWSNG